jgi:hypothetical protein
MRKPLALLAAVAALALAPAASPASEPAPGCEAFGRGVASAQPFWRGNGGFGQEVKRLLEAEGGDPLAGDRAAACAP